jgi:hypothetical protein
VFTRDHWHAITFHFPIICSSGLRDVGEVSPLETGELRYFSQPVCVNFPVLHPSRPVTVIPTPVRLSRLASNNSATAHFPAETSTNTDAWFETQE